MPGFECRADLPISSSPPAAPSSTHLKPGNVHVHAPATAWRSRISKRSAAAAAPFIADRRRSASARASRRAIEASFAAAGCNTNLGIVLLCAPLAAAAETRRRACGAARAAARSCSAALDDDDADGGVRRHPPRQSRRPRPAEQRRRSGSRRSTLLEAMRSPPSAIASRSLRHRLRRHLRFRLAGARRRLRATRDDQALAVTTLHMTLLAEFPDSHIARKHGAAMAATVLAQAQRWLPPGSRSCSATLWRKLLEFDAELKGATAQSRDHRGLRRGHPVRASIMRRIAALSRVP